MVAVNFDVILSLPARNARHATPRHACPLKGALLMQVHQWAQAAAGLARESVLRGLKRMQNHAPDACMAVSAKMTGFSGFIFRATGRPVQRVYSRNSGFAQGCIFHGYQPARPRQA